MANVTSDTLGIINVKAVNINGLYRAISFAFATFDAAFFVNRGFLFEDVKTIADKV
jgi:hypothetical protein